MSTATTKTVVFKPPYQKGFTSLTVAEKNANLEYLANLLATYLDMVVFDNLTDEDETWGNAYYIGFQNASHASLCIFCPHVNMSNYHYYCLEFVDSNNNPISEYEKYKRNGASQSGFMLYNSSVYDRYYWVLMVTCTNDAKYIQFFYPTTYEQPGAAIDYAQDRIKLGSEYNACPNMWVSKTQHFYMHYHGYGLYFIDSPVNPGRYNNTQWSTSSPNYFIRYFLDRDKKYYTDSIYIISTDNNQRFKIENVLKAILFDTAATIFQPPFNTVFKIDTEYHMVLFKYSDYPICAWDIGDTYEQSIDVI